MALCLQHLRLPKLCVLTTRDAGLSQHPSSCENFPFLCELAEESKCDMWRSCFTQQRLQHDGGMTPSTPKLELSLVLHYWATGEGGPYHPPPDGPADLQKEEHCKSVTCKHLAGAISHANFMHEIQAR